MRGVAAGGAGAGVQIPGAGVCASIQSSLLKRGGRIKRPTTRSNERRTDSHAQGSTRSPSLPRAVAHIRTRACAHARAPASVVFAPARGRTGVARHRGAGADCATAARGPRRPDRNSPVSRARSLLDHVALTITPPAPPLPHVNQLSSDKVDAVLAALAADVRHRLRQATPPPAPRFPCSSVRSNTQ